MRLFTQNKTIISQNYFMQVIGLQIALVYVGCFETQLNEDSGYNCIVYFCLFYLKVNMLICSYILYYVCVCACVCVCVC